MTEPTQPLTDAELESMRGRHKLEWIEPPDYVVGDFETPWCGECGEQHPCEVARALDEVDRLRAEAAEREAGHKGALDAMWDTVLQADAETAALRAQIEKVLSEANSWDLSDKQIDQMASDSHPVRRAEQWLKLTSYRACAESLKAILAVHHCLKCGKAMDVEHTTEFVVHMVRHYPDPPALDQSGEGQANG